MGLSNDLGTQGERGDRRGGPNLQVTHASDDHSDLPGTQLQWSSSIA